MIHFGNPFWLLGILILVPIFLFLKKRKKPSVLYSDTEWLGVKSLSSLYTHLPEYLLMGCLFFVFIALGRPQQGFEREVVRKKGIDIVIVMDISGSMRAEDFQPENRLTVAKNLATDFIEERGGDRIGFVVFAKDALIQSPLTLDHEIVKKMVDRVDFGMLGDGTAIGMGISFGNYLLSHTGSESKVMILLTDGRNNAGKIDPQTASDMAAENEVKIYTIGVGKRGKVPYPQQTIFGKRHVMVDIELNEEQLRRIAEKTGGTYDRATSPEALKEIYAKIDEMEPTTFEVERIVKYRERVHFALIPALILLLAFFIEPVISRRIP